MRIPLVALLSAIVLAHPVFAQTDPPTTLAYPGLLLDGGTPVPDGSHAIQIRLFDVASGGAVTYAEDHMATTVGGVLDVEIGGGTPVTGVWTDVEFNQAWWVETEVDGNTLTPRKALAASPYARGLTLPLKALTDYPGAALHVRNASALSGAIGIRGDATASSGVTYGLYGQSLSSEGIGVYGTAPTRGVYGWATDESGYTYGVHGESASSFGGGVYGEAPYNGVRGVATGSPSHAIGVWGESLAPGGWGVYGVASDDSDITSYGVYGKSRSTGVYGFATGFGTTYGVHGVAKSLTGRGVYGFAEAQGGSTFGVYGLSVSPSGRGVYGRASAERGNTAGVYGLSYSTAGHGVIGATTALTGKSYGVWGVSFSASGRGVYGVGRFGVQGVSSFSAPYGIGVYGVATAKSGVTIGVAGQAVSPDGFAGYFSGNVRVTGTLSKGGGSFEIDHPLDPENRILRHSFVESPDMMNVYNGNITTDGRGLATVELPEWFETLNRDFRYQLTAIRSFSRAMIAEEIRNGRFVIQTEEPNVRISWQVTGIRQDAWANQNRVVVEEDKSREQRGRYLHPSVFGQPAESGVDHVLGLEAQIEAERVGIAMEEVQRESEQAKVDDERERMGEEERRRDEEERAREERERPQERRERDQ